MADTSDRSARNQVEISNSIAENRQASKDSIRRLEDIIVLQEDRLKQTRHESGEGLSHTLQLRTYMADVLLVSKQTLETLRQSAKNLELSWAMLE